PQNQALSRKPNYHSGFRQASGKQATVRRVSTPVSSRISRWGLAMTGRITASILLAVAAANFAQAAEPTVITLSCDGTQTGQIDKKTPEPIRIGVVVDLDKRTVSWLGFVADVGDVDAANITFGGKQSFRGLDIDISGNIDRVTGHMIATTITSNPADPKKQY